MQTIATSPSAPQVAATRWHWLWSQKRDLVWTFLPFWAGFALLFALFLTRSPEASSWSVSGAGRRWDLLALAMAFYGPIVDGPHLWATIARTYVDRDEWASRRTLFLSSLLALAIGPALIVAPYVLRMFVPLPEEALDWGFQAWTVMFSLYATFHIYKQHWGFVCLYKRKNGDNDESERRADALFFPVAMWLPYLTMLIAPWRDGHVFPAITAMLYPAAHVAFFATCAGYVVLQVGRARRGQSLNGPKLLYMGTVVSLYYLTFACHPRLAAFWVLVTSTGHCLQYHGIVWAYGKKQYAPTNAQGRTLPQVIFAHPLLYAALGVLFAVVTLQGPGVKQVTGLAADVMQVSIFAYTFPFLTHAAGIGLGLKLGAAVVSGVRLHHFYVDSKIWRVSRQPSVARSLGV